MYRHSKSDLNLNSYNLFPSKKPYLKDPPFSNKNCDWYERHATLWEQFIKDHLLIGKRLASDNESVEKNNNFSQSQHFHVDPKKCKEISIELKNNIDKSVVISFVTSESSLKTVLPSDLENSKAIKIRNIARNKDIKRNYLSNNINFKRSSKDISIDTKSLESHLNNSQNNNNLGNNLQEVNKFKESNINITDYSKKYTDSSFIPKINNGRISEFSVAINRKKSNQRNLNNTKPRLSVKVRSQNKLKVHPRTPPSKSSFIKYSHNFSKSLPVNVDKINQKQKEHLNINIWKRGDGVINEKSVLPNFASNEKILSDKKLEIKTSNKKEPRDSFEKGDNTYEELLELKKKDSDKSNSSTKIEDTKFQLKKNNNKASDTKESTGWFSFPKIFHIFNPKNEPISKDNKKGHKLEKSQTVTKIQNKNNFNTYDMPRKSSPLRQNSDDSNNGDYFKYRHINHKTHYRSKSKGRAKDPAKHCIYCNRPKEEWKDFLSNKNYNTSESAIFGPTLDETIVNLISCLPNNVSKFFGYTHKLIHDEGTNPKTREDLKCNSGHVNKYEAKSSETKDDEYILEWLNNEYYQLAYELAEAKKNPGCKKAPETFESRRFVLDRLQEIMKERNYMQKKGKL